MSIIECLALVPADFEETVDGLTDGQKLELEGQLDRAITHLTVLAAYVSERGVGNDHKGSVKKSMIVRKNVRKALGYTYPERGSFSF